MGSDRIGKSGSAPPDTLHAEAAPAGASPLEQLQAGKIDLEGYLDLKVSEATSHLRGLRADEMDGLRQLLRSELARDPSLAALVEQATGQRPTPRE
jgi:hypothetical protein